MEISLSWIQTLAIKPSHLDRDVDMRVCFVGMQGEQILMIVKFTLSKKSDGILQCLGIGSRWHR